MATPKETVQLIDNSSLKSSEQPSNFSTKKEITIDSLYKIGACKKRKLKLIRFR